MNDKKNKLRIPDPAEFNPKADASDWPIQRGGQTDVKAFQFVGGIRPKAEPKPAPQKE